MLNQLPVKSGLVLFFLIQYEKSEKQINISRVVSPILNWIDVDVLQTFLCLSYVYMMSYTHCLAFALLENVILK